MEYLPWLAIVKDKTLIIKVTQATRQCRFWLCDYAQLYRGTWRIVNQIGQPASIRNFGLPLPTIYTFRSWV